LRQLTFLLLFIAVVPPVPFFLYRQGGNSGGPVIDQGTGAVVAIHTNGGCSSSGGSNIGKKIYPGTLAHIAYLKSLTSRPTPRPTTPPTRSPSTPGPTSKPSSRPTTSKPSSRPTALTPSTSNGTPNVVESLVRTNDRQAVVHATTDGNPNVVEALLRAILGSADNSEPDAAPDDSDAHVQAILGKADNSEPDAAPDHSSADRAADRALHTNMCSCRGGELY
jgi:hypothetical protein